MSTRIYTDGGCNPNPGPGGWAAIILRPGAEPEEHSGSEDDTTNNRMELRATIEALKRSPAGSRIELVTDSSYVKNGITTWMPAWVRRGWKTAAGAPVKNADLWRVLKAEVARHEIRWKWVKGHAGDKWNERADELASAAMPRPDLPLGDRGSVHLFTAAAYTGTGKKGSWAATLCFREEAKELTGHTAPTTPNAMHIRSAIEGLTALKRPTRVHVYTVSDYLAKGATQWMSAWKRRGWRTAEDKPVSNLELWKQIDELQGHHTVEWHVIDKDDMPSMAEDAKDRAKAELKRV